jgi:hypothetical protein
MSGGRSARKAAQPREIVERSFINRKSSYAVQ